MLVAPNHIDLTVTDVKQWAYCARIPFYRYVMPVDHRRTFNMERGKAAEAAVAALERRRRLREYGIRDGERQFGVSLRSTRLGLSGKLDLLITTPDSCFPVDFKDTEGGVRRNHRIQLAAYALLTEEVLHRKVPAGFIYLVPNDEVVRVPMTPACRTDVTKIIHEIRSAIATERLPDPTAIRARCQACEYRNYCGDIW